MTVFRHRIKGALPGGSWSAGLVTTGSIAESAAQTAWHTGVGTMWGDITTYFGTDTTLTLSTTSTLSPTFKQTTISSNAEAFAGTSAADSLPGRLALRITGVTAQATKAGTHSGMDLPAPATNAVGVGGIVLAAAVTALVNGFKGVADQLVLSGLTIVSLNPSTGVTIPWIDFKVRNTMVSRKNRVSKQAITYTSSGL